MELIVQGFHYDVKFPPEHKTSIVVCVSVQSMNSYFSTFLQTSNAAACTRAPEVAKTVHTVIEYGCQSWFYLIWLYTHTQSLVNYGSDDRILSLNSHL